MKSFYGIKNIITRHDKFNLPEKSLNLLLRRADWRFFMSNPNPKKSICFAVGDLADAVNLISEHVINPESNYNGNDCDLAVLANPDQENLEAAWSSLKTGGCCYIEWEVNPFFKPIAIRCNLEAAGFKQVTLYLPKPSPNHSITTTWIPIEDPRGIDFFIKDTLRNYTTFSLRRVGGILRSIAWFLFSDLFISYPWLLSLSLRNFMLCSIAYKSTSQDLIHESPNNKQHPLDTTSKISKLESCQIDSLEAELRSLGIIHNANTVSMLMSTSGLSIYNKAILYVFTGNDNQPSYVIKNARIAESSSFLENEAKVLRTIQDNYGGIDGIPNLLYIKHNSGFCTVGEGYIRGVPTFRMLKKQNYRELAIIATHFQVRLAEHTKIKAPEDWRDMIMKPILSYFNSSFESVLDPKLIQKSNDILTNLDLTHLICVHNDFSVWNTLINSDKKLGLIDWEGCTLQGLPAVDLINFLTNLGFYLHNAWEQRGMSECYRRVLNEKVYEGKIFNECLTYYSDRIGIPNSLIPSLRLFTWVNAMNWRHFKLNNFVDEPASPAVLRNIQYIGLWEEELLLSDFKAL